MAYSLLQLALVTRESDYFSFLLFATERTVEFFGKDDIGFIYCDLAKFLASFERKAGLFCFLVVRLAFAVVSRLNRQAGRSC
jgi:hypothetical protein